MTRRAVSVLLAGGMLCLAAPTRVSRADLKALELGFDRRIEQANIDDPFERLGDTRAVYLENYGVVFSAEMNLVTTAISPFRPKLSAEEIQKLRQKKLSRLPQLRRIMRDMMVTSATSLKTVLPEEQIVMSVTLINLSWEDTNGIPAQIVMQAKRRILTEFEAGRISANAFTSSIQEAVY